MSDAAMSGLNASLPLALTRRPRKPRQPSLLLSVLLHLLVLAVLIALVDTIPPLGPPDRGAKPSDFEMVFENAPKSAEPREGMPDMTTPGAVETPTVPPNPDAKPAPSQPNEPAQTVRPTPATPLEAPPPVRVAPAPELPPAPAPLPSPFVPPLEVTPNGTAPPAQSAVPRTAPSIPAPVRPEPRPPARPAPRARNDFPALMPFSLSKPTERSPYARDPAPSRYADRTGGSTSGETTSPRSAASLLMDYHFRDGDPGFDFQRAMLKWWNDHSFYPEGASDRGEEGDVLISMVVNRDGRVIEVTVEGRSGSRYLDMAGRSTWDDAKLLPLPSSLHRDTLTIDARLHYYIVR